MTRGKKWTIQEETELKTLIETDATIEDIAAKLGKTPQAIIVKCRRLGLKPNPKNYLNTIVPLPRELPSIEEALKMIAGALKASTKPGLNKMDVQRLKTVASIAKTYKDILSDYINYRNIEAKLKEMEEQNAQILKERSPSSSPQPDSATMAQHPEEQQANQAKPN